MDSGGAEKSVVEITAALTRAGGRSLLASGPGRLISEFEAAGGTWIPFKAGTKNPVLLVTNAFRLAGLIRRENVKIIHARSRAPAWSALMAARMTGIAFVTTNHGAHSYRGRLKRFYNSVMARGDRVIANSEYTAERLRHYHEVDAARLRVVPRGVDLAAYDPAAIERQRLFSLRDAWGLQASPARIVLLPARLSPRKGHETVIEAARLLPADLLKQIVILFVGAAQGRNDQTRRIAQAIEAANLSGHIRLAGHCADMAAAYAMADLVLVPSTEPEAFGRVAAEAQMMGVPVIASDLGAVSETVLAPPDVAESERTGWRVPAGDAKALAQAMQAALSLDENGRAALASRGKSHIGKHFSLARMTEGTLKVYDDLLGSDLAGRGGADTAKG
jgi:glycosyltransferase involved in cell wall biosynthesis